MKKVNVKKFMMVFLLFIIIDGCSNLSEINLKMMYRHDFDNPCTCDYDTVMCNNWKKKYPKDYLRYTERMKVYQADSLKKEQLKCN